MPTVCTPSRAMSMARVDVAALMIAVVLRVKPRAATRL